MTDSLIELLSRCRHQDSRAQTEIYRLYSRAMYNVAVRIVKDAHYAEDVMQESFLKAFSKLNDYRQEVAFGAWLKRIVINHSIDFCKRNKKFPTQDFETTLIPVRDDADASDAEDFSKIKAVKVTQAMQSIRPAYQLILNLYFIEGYDHEEISEILGINYSNCRTTLSRARESLRKKLKEDERES
ncbi:RNA polymerase sigma factor [Flavobacterium silvaticum]|uniref:RNA polymerase sigma factor n=1 Tax=Flavobacterium silvaticum TaxID=1852020 RepID=A0A972JHE9_9FLAO|nr:RNA polymerase sigma factor [Flavobacterium silvaticum]NMH29171.1 RNA polymerase sigma factor [Flavobacterium silvaticum]